MVSKFQAIRTTADSTFPGYPTLSSRHHESSLYKGKVPRTEGCLTIPGEAMRALAPQAGRKARGVSSSFFYLGSEAGDWVDPWMRICLG